MSMVSFVTIYVFCFFFPSQNASQVMIMNHYYVSLKCFNFDWILCFGEERISYDYVSLKLRRMIHYMLYMGGKTESLIEQVFFFLWWSGHSHIDSLITFDFIWNHKSCLWSLSIKALVPLQKEPRETIPDPMLFMILTEWSLKHNLLCSNHTNKRTASLTYSANNWFFLRVCKYQRAKDLLEI